MTFSLPVEQNSALFRGLLIDWQPLFLSWLLLGGLLTNWKVLKSGDFFLVAFHFILFILLSFFFGVSTETRESQFRMYSSFHEGMLKRGLKKQAGLAHAWHTFGGPLSCFNQSAQCALTPILPFAWWDAPMQSPRIAEIKLLRKKGLAIGRNGTISEKVLRKFCHQSRVSGRRKNHPF